MSDNILYLHRATRVVTQLSPAIEGQVRIICACGCPEIIPAATSHQDEQLSCTSCRAQHRAPWADISHIRSDQEAAVTRYENRLRALGIRTYRLN